MAWRLGLLCVGARLSRSRLTRAVLSFQALSELLRAWLLVPPLPKCGLGVGGREDVIASLSSRLIAALETHLQVVVRGRKLIEAFACRRCLQANIGPLGYLPLLKGLHTRVKLLLSARFGL